MRYYVVGFAFNYNCSRVLLVEKLRPEWMKGCLNGIRGHIEAGEFPTSAMNRECKEETGLVLDWEYKGKMWGINNNGNSFVCYVFYSYDNKVSSYEQKGDEPLALYHVQDIINYRTVANLGFLVPYGVCKDGSRFMSIEYA